MNMDRHCFPACKLSLIDYFIGACLLFFCFFSFVHGDIYATGWNSLNYLFGNPLDFYENCKKIQGEGIVAAASYPPSIFIIFALWLYPFKWFGLIKSSAYFLPILVYWLKLLTSLVYMATGFVFYKVTQFYLADKAWSKYATCLWLTTPLALFSQFIFSQYDIFYTFFTLWAFLVLLKRKMFLGSFLFGIAITFKYFPFFVFLPLLVFLEKKLLRLLVCGLVFLAPIFFIQLIYGHSPAYREGVLGFSAIGRVFFAYLSIGKPNIYYIFVIFTILVGICYTLDSTRKNSASVAAYIYLFSAIFPFLFIIWHPQWVLFFTPAIVLTTLLMKEKAKIKQLLLFDLIGMVFFVAYVSLAFQSNVDLAMFQYKLFHSPMVNVVNMAVLFKLFKGFSANVYLSVFWGYLVLQFIIKYSVLRNDGINSNYSYKDIRLRYVLGLLIFLIPALVTLYLNYKNNDRYVVNFVRDKNFGELTSGRAFEQQFIARTSSLNQVDLFLSSFSRVNFKPFKLAILSKDYRPLAEINRSAFEVLDNGWEAFKFGALKLKKGHTYILRLSSVESKPGDAITWWASKNPSYKEGFAKVDGIIQNSDFAFRLKFARDK
ncbi:MAG: glycosyltransferase family 87 protein [Rickettsia endosymbiont of Ixodes persulcatus]|nr:glycosyltransferase family 87 protein [Rickettsia endosymbiont of Ixodes persulcatus]